MNLVQTSKTFLRNAFIAAAVGATVGGSFYAFSSDQSFKGSYPSLSIEDAHNLRVNTASSNGGFAGGALIVALSVLSRRRENQPQP